MGGGPESKEVSHYAPETLCFSSDGEPASSWTRSCWVHTLPTGMCLDVSRWSGSCPVSRLFGGVIGGVSEMRHVEA